MIIGGIGSMASAANAANMAGLGGVGGAPGSARPGAEDAAQGAGGEGSPFARLLSELGNSSRAADGAMTDLATGGGNDLHDVVISMQMESLAFDLAVQIRNRLVDAYSEIFRMQV